MFRFFLALFSFILDAGPGWDPDGLDARPGWDPDGADAGPGWDPNG